jgi:hypothetical protein
MFEGWFVGYLTTLLGTFLMRRRNDEWRNGKKCGVIGRGLLKGDSPAH